MACSSPFATFEDARRSTASSYRTTGRRAGVEGAPGWSQSTPSRRPMDPYRTRQSLLSDQCFVTLEPKWKKWIFSLGSPEDPVLLVRRNLVTGEWPPRAEMSTSSTAVGPNEAGEGGEGGDRRKATSLQHGGLVLVVRPCWDGIANLPLARSVEQVILVC